MNFKQLEIFTVLADTLNFTKTAEQLYLSQTTVTLQIKSLEEELGVKLFDRTSRSVRLTYPGEVFLEGAKELLEKSEQTVRRTRLVSKGYTGQLRIGFADEMNATGLAGMLREFSKTQPQVLLNIRSEYPGSLLKGLLADEYDVIFTPSFRKIGNEKLSRHVMGTYRTVAAFQRDHPFGKKKELKYSDFEGENIIVISGEAQELDSAADFLHQLDVHNINYNQVAKTDTIDAVFIMLEAGMGVTVLNEYLAPRFSGPSTVTVRPIAEDLKTSDFLAVWKRQVSLPELALFLEETGIKDDGKR